MVNAMKKYNAPPPPKENLFQFGTEFYTSNTSNFFLFMNYSSFASVQGQQHITLLC